MNAMDVALNLQGFGGCEPAGNCEDAVGWRKVRLQAVGTV